MYSGNAHTTSDGASLTLDGSAVRTRKHSRKGGVIHPLLMAIPPTHAVRHVVDSVVLTTVPPEFLKDESRLSTVPLK